jgi:hypothetical protein
MEIWYRDAAMQVGQEAVRALDREIMRDAVYNYQWVRRPGETGFSELLDPNELGRVVLRTVLENGQPVIEVSPEYRRQIAMLPRLLREVSGEVDHADGD